MNLQEMLSKMSPQMLAQGLKQISGKLAPDQLKQAESAIKSMSSGDLKNKLNNLDAEQLKQQLQNNPDLAKQLASNPELLTKLTSIVKNK